MSRLDRESRKSHIIEAAAELAAQTSYLKLTRDNVALAASVSVTLVTHYFGAIENLQKQVLLYAKKTKNAVILEQARVNNDAEGLQ